jgi:hypothetical protein
MPEDIPAAADLVRKDGHRHPYASKTCVRCPEPVAPARPKKARPKASREVIEYDVEPGPSVPPRKRAPGRRKSSSGRQPVEVIDYGVEVASHG